MPERRRTIRLTGTSLNVDGTAEPETVFPFAGHGKPVATVLLDAVTEADVAEFEQLEANFAQILAVLEDSNKAQVESQAVIAELRESTEAALSELAEVVAAL